MANIFQRSIEAPFQSIRPFVRSEEARPSIQTPISFESQFGVNLFCDALRLDDVQDIVNGAEDPFGAFIC